MSFSSMYYANFLLVTRGILEKTGNYPEFLAVIAGYGYDNARFEQGKTYCNEFYRYHHRYLEKRQAALSKTKALDAQFRKVFTEYVNFVKRLRWELKGDPETRILLGTTGDRERSRAGFIDQSTNFYTMAMKPEILAKIQQYGISFEKLSDGLQHVREYVESRSRCDSMHGECRELIEKRNRAYIKLRDWMTALIVSSKIAYAGNLQGLEKLGMFMLTRSRRKKKEENRGTVVAQEKPLQEKLVQENETSTILAVKVKPGAMRPIDERDVDKAVQIVLYEKNEYPGGLYEKAKLYQETFIEGYWITSKIIPGKMTDPGWSNTA